MDRDLKNIQSAHEISDEFKLFINRKQLHNDEERRMLFDDMPKLFFKDSIIEACFYHLDSLKLAV